MSSHQYKKCHYGDKMILWMSNLHIWISYTGKVTSLYTESGPRFWTSKYVIAHARGYVKHRIDLKSLKDWLLWVCWESCDENGGHFNKKTYNLHYKYKMAMSIIFLMAIPIPRLSLHWNHALAIVLMSMSPHVVIGSWNKGKSVIP